MPPLFDFIKKILYNIYRNKKEREEILWVVEETHFVIFVMQDVPTISLIKRIGFIYVNIWINGVLLKKFKVYVI